MYTPLKRFPARPKYNLSDNQASNKQRENLKYNEPLSH